MTVGQIEISEKGRREERHAHYHATTTFTNTRAKTHIYLETSGLTKA